MKFLARKLTRRVGLKSFCCKEVEMIIKLLVREGSKVGVDKNIGRVPSFSQGWSRIWWKNVKLGDLNKLAYNNLILAVSTSSTVVKFTYDLVWNVKSSDNPKGNSKLVWNSLVNNYALHTASSLLRLKSEFHNSKLDSTEKDPEKGMSNLEWNWLQMTNFRLKGNMVDKKFVIHISNNLPECAMILDGL